MLSHDEKKCGFVTIIGRPSTGKSSFVNRVVGHKTVIVSPLPQTTQKSIRGIYNEDRGQIIFLDTPGIHQSEQRFNQSLNSQATSTIEDSDLVIYMADISRAPGQEEKDIVAILQNINKNILLVLNKIDQERTYHTEYELFFEEYWPGQKVHQISIVTGAGIDDLKNKIFENLPIGPLMYPEDVYTDQDPSFRIAEIIREQAINRVREEVPHSIYVEIADLEMQKDFLWIRAFLMVERETQKGMLVGKKGVIIHAIKMASLKGIKKLFNLPIKLDLQVKVDREWRKNNHRLKSLFG